MAEFRLNNITREQILIVESRSKRPKDFKSAETAEKVKYKDNCPFCVGNEDNTPPEIFRLGSPWEVRVVENKFPILDREGDITGYHYVLIETADHSKGFHEMDEEEIFKVFKSYVEVCKKLYEKDDVKYVQVFKNYKKEAGASLEHPHSQIIAIKKMPDKINNKIRKYRELYFKNSRCLMCKTIEEELQYKERVVYHDEDFIIYCPFASIFPYEMAIAPIKHKSSILNLCDDDIRKFSGSVLKAIFKLNQNIGDVPYNMYLDFIKNENNYYHYEVRLCPRLSINAGFEIATGLYTNIVSPETAAKILRD
ncbi:UDPglucose--hexose-1-phosphate uridylyltransferase [Caloramator quimbayensis]|uniref:UDPglucose--hexose-1-phosphate uridylyltransferase n=1 Tax=Caloramator quimbayensis TaxID=1147123 RepID=A0A1T4Y1F3_9CLOT|nr:DUF4931 domain-containing protein [Caloramator quimbayensis]SKA95151.1 UDPglucose--hexose-1-phosphate uridylyltransferase [Caloramator quimbayensis]